MGTYAGLGVGIAVFSFIFSFLMRYDQPIDVIVTI